MNLPEVYVSQLNIPQADGSTYQGHGGSFMIHDGNIHHLSPAHDMDKWLPEGPLTPDAIKKIATQTDTRRTGSLRSIAEGRRLDMVPEAKLEHPYTPPPDPTHDNLSRISAEPIERPPSVFDYHRAGHDRPHALEVQDGQYLLDGAPLTHTEVHTVLQNLKNGAASLRYRTGKTASAVRKAELLFRGLRKADDEEVDPVESALSYFEGMNGGDAEGGEHLKALRRHAYNDPLMTGVGNAYAWKQFAKKQKPGTYASMDMNDLKAANDTPGLGHSAGDAMLRAYGDAARQAADEVGQEHIKLFRKGGDELVMHASQPEHAYNFVRKMRDKLDQVPPVPIANGKGSHRVSFSAGLGPDFDTADRALLRAKLGKYDPNGIIYDAHGAVDSRASKRAFPVGQTPHFIHSFIPGSEGAVPQDNAVVMPEGFQLPDQQHLPSPPPASMAPPSAPAPATPSPAPQSAPSPAKPKLK